jgi:hypothetical protein
MPKAIVHAIAVPTRLEVTLRGATVSEENNVGIVGICLTVVAIQRCLSRLTYLTHRNERLQVAERCQHTQSSKYSLTKYASVHLQICNYENSPWWNSYTQSSSVIETYYDYYDTTMCDCDNDTGFVSVDH